MITADNETPFLNLNTRSLRYLVLQGQHCENMPERGLYWGLRLSVKLHNKILSRVLCVCVITCVLVHLAAVRSLWSAGSQQWEERRLQDYSDGRDDHLILSQSCAERDKGKENEEHSNKTMEKVVLCCHNFCVSYMYTTTYSQSGGHCI